MRFLADEHIPSSVVQALRQDGHDVLWAAETGRQVPDASHMATAIRERRVILTEDADFSELLVEFAASVATGTLAVHYFRLDGLGRDAKNARMLAAILEIGEPVARFVMSVVEPTRIRQRSFGPGLAEPSH
jgi:Domain of unknown function (DUF5615)